MKNVEDVKVIFAMNFKIVAQSPGAKAKKVFPGADEFAERFARVGKIISPQVTDRLDGGELREGIKFLEFTESLSRERNLEHGA